MKMSQNYERINGNESDAPYVHPSDLVYLKMWLNGFLEMLVLVTTFKKRNCYFAKYCILFRSVSCGIETQGHSYKVVYMARNSSGSSWCLLHYSYHADTLEMPSSFLLRHDNLSTGRCYFQHPLYASQLFTLCHKPIAPFIFFFVSVDGYLVLSSVLFLVLVG